MCPGAWRGTGRSGKRHGLPKIYARIRARVRSAACSLLSVFLRAGRARRVLLCAIGFAFLICFGGHFSGMTAANSDLFEMRRLESLSNTIFGVAMTLLAYDLPKADQFTSPPGWALHPGLPSSVIGIAAPGR